MSMAFSLSDLLLIWASFDDEILSVVLLEEGGEEGEEGAAGGAANAASIKARPIFKCHLSIATAMGPIAPMAGQRKSIVLVPTSSFVSFKKAPRMTMSGGERGREAGRRVGREEEGEVSYCYQAADDDGGGE